MDADLKLIRDILTDELLAHGFPLVYKGKLSHQIMKQFTTMAEDMISKTCKDSSVQRRVYHVLVEMLQNITRHSDDYEEDGVGNGIFVVGERQDYFYVITGNIIKYDKSGKLQKYLDYLNGLNKDELDQLHRTQMKGGELSKKGGAGLGLIDIIRKTGYPLVYQLENVDDNRKFFIAKVTVPKQGIEF